MIAAMPLHLTKIAFGAQSYSDIESWYAGRRSPHLTTKNRPIRWQDCIGGSLYWIFQHSIVARSEILGFSQTDSGRWLIELAPELIRVAPRPKRAHQGWRYLEEANAPPDLDSVETDGRDEMSPKMLNELMKMGLV